MRMTASFGSSILGVSRSSNRMSPGPQSTAPLMVRLLVPLVCPGSDAWSLHRHPAVDGEGMADHVARPRAAKPENRRGDLLRPARPADGDVLRDFGIRLLAPGDDVAGDLGIDQAGIDRVHADAVLDVFERRRPGQA